MIATRSTADTDRRHATAQDLGSTGVTASHGRDAAFPARRMRRLRRTPALRRLVAETVAQRRRPRRPPFRPGGNRTSRSRSRRCPGIPALGFVALGRGQESSRASASPAIVLFGVPDTKDATGSGAWDPDGIAQVALRELRASVGDELVLIADLCLDEYTDHGHCGVLAEDGRSTTTRRSSSTAASPSPRPTPARTSSRRAG